MWDLHHIPLWDLGMSCHVRPTTYSIVTPVVCPVVRFTPYSIVRPTPCPVVRSASYCVVSPNCALSCCNTCSSVLLWNLHHVPLCVLDVVSPVVILTPCSIVLLTPCPVMRPVVYPVVRPTPCSIVRPRCALLSCYNTCGFVLLRDLHQVSF